MPLSLPESRKRLHARTVSFECFTRADGLFDIEARLTDVKDHDYTLLSGVRRSGDPVHDMWVRVTIDRTFRIQAVEVKADWVPYPGGCDLIEAAYAKLVGANLVDGFRKALYEAMGGVHGCTHITELLSYVPTAAVQMFAGLTREDAGERKPFQLDRCHALETSSETVRRYYPKWYRGAA
jgi:hypothetical protein